MAREIDELLEKIRRLSQPDRDRLLRALLAELDGPSDPDADRAWLAEVQRRSAELDAGRVKTVPSEQVFERIRSRLKQ